MNKRDLKIRCYKESLEDSLISVEMTLNHFNKIKEKMGQFDEKILEGDYVKTTIQLELTLSNLCIIIRKMTENNIITIDSDLRVDINSIIHSNRFDYQKNVIVYSRKGEEKVDLGRILDFSHEILSNDNLFKENEL